MADVTLSSILSSGFPYRKQAIITSSQMWTLPPTASPSVDYDIIGGGGAGASSSTANNRYYADGGNGGKRVRGEAYLTPGNSYSIVIGAGGIGNAASADTTPAAGGASSAFGITAAGGTSVRLGSNTSPFGGFPGSGSVVIPTSISLNGGFGEDGVCSGGGGSGGLGGPGAGNGSLVSPGTGGNATAAGCGGGGAFNNTIAAVIYRGGDGYRGEVRITYWDSVP